MIFDTHAHYDDERFDEDRDELLRSMPDRGVGLILNPGITVETSRMAVEMAHKYPHMYAAVGIHPENCDDFQPEMIDQLRELAKDEKVKAIGEIGLDYYWEDNAPRDVQKKVFRAQLELALELDLPVIIHDREAHGDTLAIVQEYPGLRGEFHCFSGSPEMARELLKMGWYLGFDGPITFKNNKKAPAVVDTVPLDRMLLETDSPYLTPAPHRGKRNDSGYLPFVAAKIAEWKGITAEEVEQITWDNGKRFFGIE